MYKNIIILVFIGGLLLCCNENKAVKSDTRQVSKSAVLSGDGIKFSVDGVFYEGKTDTFKIVIDIQQREAGSFEYKTSEFVYLGGVLTDTINTSGWQEISF